MYYHRGITRISQMIQHCCQIMTNISLVLKICITKYFSQNIIEII